MDQCSSQLPINTLRSRACPRFSMRTSPHVLRIEVYFAADDTKTGSASVFRGDRSLIAAASLQSIRRTETGGQEISNQSVHPKTC
jgi:hypothetical protein